MLKKILEQYKKLVGSKTKKHINDYEIEINGEKPNRAEDKIYYQLEGQKECWVLIAGTTNIYGKKTVFKEIGRQIAAGEFREG